MTQINSRSNINLLRHAVVLALLLVPAVPAAAFHPEESASALHQKLTGVVSKITDGVVFVKTPVGQVSFGANFAARGGFADAQVGQEVTLWISGNNTVLDVRKKGEAEPVYRLMTGDLLFTSDLKDEILLRTPEGEKQFPVERGKSKLSAIMAGEPVTVELNQAGDMIDIHRGVEMTIEVAPSATEQAGSHMKLTGEVTKIRSGMAFVKTPVGWATFGPEMGLTDIRVGDTVVLMINDNNSVIDVYRKGEPAPVHRFITGKLAYASDLKNEIKLWTPEGEQAFPVLRGKSKLSAVEEGTPISVELNEAGKVIDVRKAG